MSETNKEDNRKDGENMTNSSQRKTGIVLQYVQMGLSIILSLIYTPIMLQILGKNEYGLYNLAATIISYLSLLSLGFGASYIRFYAKYKKNNENVLIGKLNGLYLITFIAIGLVALIGGFVLAHNVSIFFNETYTQEDRELAVVLMRFMSINLAWSFPASVFVSYVTAHEKFVFQKSLNIVRTVASPFLTIPALFLGWGSVGMIVVITVVGFAVDLVNIVFCLTKLKMTFCFTKLDFRLLKDIASFSVFIAINQVIDQINWTTDKVILGKLCNSVAVAYYAIGAQINTYFTQFSTAVSSVFVPKIHQIENSEIDEEQKNLEHTRLFIQVGRIQFMILMLIITGFVFFGDFFVRKWAGEDYTTSYYVALLLMTPALIPLMQNVGIEVQRAKNKHQFRSLVYLAMALVNVGITIVFAKMWGEIGAALGTTISLLIANGLIMNIFYHKVIHINILAFWKEIIKIVPALILPVAVGTIVKCLYSFGGLWDFGLLVLAYSLVYITSMLLIGLNSEEKKTVHSAIKKLLRLK